MAMPLLFVALFGFSFPAAAEQSPGQKEGIALEAASLEQCLDEALKNNRRRPASRYAVEMAEAQHRQALAGYWPQLSVKGGYQRLDEAPNYIVPSLDINLPGGGVTLPGLGFVPVGPITIPEQEIKLQDPESFRASGNASWLLFDGGMRKGLREQAGGVVEMMKQESRRTDLEIIDSVKRLYYGAVLAARLHQIGKDTLARMETTLSLTESLYKGGSSKVKKTDWLDNRVMVESLRALIASLEKNELMAQAALANTMGRPWHCSVKPRDLEMPYAPYFGQLDNLASTAYRFNPDWAKIEAGIRAAEGAVRSAKSGFFPKLAVTGEIFKWWNDHDTGVATDENKEGWSVNVGVELPIFNGFLTKNRVAETRARVAKIKEEQFLLQEGIGLQIKDIFLAMKAAEKAHQATQEAMTAAEENRDLNTRAYQHELVETEDVLRAQLMEALMSARHYKSRFDHLAL
ncbi:MAG: TolC family protein, partial [Deltaproteobacteria bacterium]|nr:TolC family protein [Deltaproteobacteria bacterium]